MARRGRSQPRESPPARHRAQLIDRAATAKRESRYLDFKEVFDPSSTAEWCELVKDLVAVANSGGGVIVIGVRNDGTASGADLQPILELDPAKITDQVFRYTGEHLSGFEVLEVERASTKAVAIVIEAADDPLIFSKPGTYVLPGGTQQKTAFSRGTLYVRHGAKSEPASTSDLARLIEQRIGRAREQLMEGVQRVVEAPADSEVAIVRRPPAGLAGRQTAIRVTTDPGAPVYGKLDSDDTHPYRQKEVVAEVNKRLAGKRRVNRHDIQCVREIHRLTQASAPDFVDERKFGSQQYSDAFVDWLVSEYGKEQSSLRMRELATSSAARSVEAGGDARLISPSPRGGSRGGAP